VTTRELLVRHRKVSLAGSLWRPGGDAVATVLMHPGSGPSDRDNDVYFPPIREHLLAHGITVCSFDKRGVGGSTGRWQDAGIVEQADDVLACIRSLLDDDAVSKPVGLFGHSQGGWVVIEAAGRRPQIGFVVTSSGPGVTPAVQERYSHCSYLLAHGVRADELDAALVPFDQLIERLRGGAAFDDIRRLLDRERLPEPYRRLELTLFPEDDELWSFFRRIADFEPQIPLARITVPLLATFGGDDPIVPVDDSVRAFRDALRPDLLTVAVFPGADHRPADASGYLETLSGFVRRSVDTS
jgi:pimeloyl-ACP methyl ester carboxylesterase